MKNKKLIIFLLLILIIIVLSFFTIKLHQKLFKNIFHEYSKYENNTSAVIYDKETKTLNEWKNINKDTLFILKINGKEFPVVKGNDEYYLHHDIYNKEDKFGTVFLDNDFTDENLLIYGHSSTKKDIIFTFMKKYLNDDFYNENNTFKITLENEEKEYQILALKSLNLEVDNDRSFFKTNFDTLENKLNYINNFYDKADKIFTENISISKNNKLITFVTCDLEKKDARFLILASEVVKND